MNPQTLLELAGSVFLLFLKYFWYNELSLKIILQGRVPPKGTEGAKLLSILAKQQAKLSGKRTLHLRTSGESPDTEGAKSLRSPDRGTRRISLRVLFC